MNVVVALSAMLFSQQAAAESTAPVRLTSYEEAVHCAGLTQAASELEGGETPRGRRLYDAALYWSLSTIQAARVAGRDPTATEQSMTRIRIGAVRRLAANDSGLREHLNDCIRRAPDLK